MRASSSLFSSLRATQGVQKQQFGSAMLLGSKTDTLMSDEGQECQRFAVARRRKHVHGNQRIEC